MARRKRCVVKRRRKEEGNRRKREEKEENIGDQIAKKSVRMFFLFAVVIYGPINTLKQTISTFVFMQDIIDEQIRRLSRFK